MGTALFNYRDGHGKLGDDYTKKITDVHGKSDACLTGKYPIWTARQHGLWRSISNSNTNYSKHNILCNLRDAYIRMHIPYRGSVHTIMPKLAPIISARNTGIMITIRYYTNITHTNMTLPAI